MDIRGQIHVMRLPWTRVGVNLSHPATVVGRPRVSPESSMYKGELGTAACEKDIGPETIEQIISDNVSA